MSKVLFISANNSVDPYPVYPLGMSVVAASLMDAGHTVQLFDYLFEEESIKKLEEKAKSFQPDYFCITIRNIDNVDSFSSEETWQLDRIRNMIRSLKQLLNIPVICGGPGFSIMPDILLDYLEGDYGVQGQGEGVLSVLLSRIENKEPVSRISRASDFGVQPIQGASYYNSELVRYYYEKSGLFSLQTKRGCPYRCVYCSYPTIEGKTFRSRNIDAVIDDIKRAVRDFSVTDFFFTDSVFNDSQAQHMELVERLLEEDVKIRWSAFFTPGKQSASDLELMKRSGLFAVELGTDASSDTTLRGLKKPFLFEDARHYSDLCIQLKIPCAHYVIFGGPGETMDTVREGVENLLNLGKCVVLAFSCIRILPNTAIHKLAVKEGIVTEDDDLLKPVYYVSPDVDYDEMNAYITNAFAGRMDRVFPPSRGTEMANRLRKMGVRGLIWDKLVKFR